MEIGQKTPIYGKALSNGEWFGGWALVRALLEWLRTDNKVGLFTFTEPGLNKYELF